MKWISVEDRLPEDEKTVICWCKAIQTVVAKDDGFVEFAEYYYFDNGHTSGFDWDFGDINDNHLGAVTHWMPLPDPPEDK